MTSDGADLSGSGMLRSPFSPAEIVAAASLSRDSYD
jgi:hypothetical protein